MAARSNVNTRSDFIPIIRISFQCLFWDKTMLIIIMYHIVIYSDGNWEEYETRDIVLFILFQ